MAGRGRASGCAVPGQRGLGGDPCPRPPLRAHGPDAGSGGEGRERARQRVAMRRCLAGRWRARGHRPGGPRIRGARALGRRHSPHRSRPTIPSLPGSGATRARRRRCSAWARCSDGARCERAGHQAPVSYRILPRVLGQAERALADAQRGAGSSLSSVTDNPVFLVSVAAAPARARVQHRRLSQRHGAADAACADGRLCRPLPPDRASRRGALDGPRQAPVSGGRGAPEPPAHGHGRVGGGGGGRRTAADPAAEWTRSERCRRAGLRCLAAKCGRRRRARFVPRAAVRNLDPDHPRRRIPLAPALRDRYARITAICPATSRPYDASIATLAASVSDEVYGPL